MVEKLVLLTLRNVELREVRFENAHRLSRKLYYLTLTVFLYAINVCLTLLLPAS